MIKKVLKAFQAQTSELAKKQIHTYWFFGRSAIWKATREKFILIWSFSLFTPTQNRAHANEKLNQK